MDEIAEGNVADEPDDPSGEARRPLHMRVPVTTRRHTEHEARQEQEEHRGESALKLPDVVPPSLAVHGREHRVDCVPVDHEDHGACAREVDEDDAAAGGAQCVIAWRSTLIPTAYPSGEN
jgi:hypothetical protein